MFEHRRFEYLRTTFFYPNTHYLLQFHFYFTWLDHPEGIPLRQNLQRTHGFAMDFSGLFKQIRHFLMFPWGKR